MATSTPNLHLFKYNTATDGKEIFSIEQALNHNWDILDNLGSGRNIGEIVSSIVPLTDAGLHLLDGALIDGSGIYSEFVNYMKNLYGDGTNVPSYFCSEEDWQDSITSYGVCGKFVFNRSNNTIRLPKITGIIEGTTDLTALGDLIEAGLPNITGAISANVSWTGATANGALYSTSHGQNYVGGYDWQEMLDTIYIDSSRSSAIYGNSNTVQPQTIKVLYYICIATSKQPGTSVNIDEIITDLNGKCDVDGTNAIFAHIIETYQTGASWYRIYSDGFCEQGGEVLNLSYGGTTSTVIYLKPFINTNYTLTFGTFGDGYPYAETSFRCTSYSATDCTFYNNSGTLTTYKWQACGYIR